MKKIVFALAFLSTVVLTAQNEGTVTGEILDVEMDGQPLAFANVDLKNTPYKTQTNLDGNFELVNVAPGEYTLVVSYLGYETMELPIQVERKQITSISKSLGAKTLGAAYATSMTSEQSTGEPDASKGN